MPDTRLTYTEALKLLAHRKLKLTDAERQMLAGQALQGAQARADELTCGSFVLPPSFRGLGQNDAESRQRFERLFDATLSFVDGLAAWARIRPGMPDGEFRRAVVQLALEKHRVHVLELATDLPEFGFWVNLDQHVATTSALAEAGHFLGAAPVS